LRFRRGGDYAEQRIERDAAPVQAVMPSGTVGWFLGAFLLPERRTPW
jgi:hypothetical protein